MSSLATSVRRGFAALAASGLLAAAVAAPASAEVTVSVKVSSKFAVVGFPVTATVTSSESGKLYLSQVRNDGLRATGPGYCGHPDQWVLRDFATRDITANTPLKVTINPASLAYFGGDLFNNGSGCWDQATIFNRLLATVDGPEYSRGQALTAFQSVL